MRLPTWPRTRHCAPFEGWRPSSVPQRIRDKQEFRDRVGKEIDNQLLAGRSEDIARTKVDPTARRAHRLGMHISRSTLGYVCVVSLGFGLYACEREVDKTTETTEKPRAAAEQPAAAPKPAEEPATMPAIAQPEGKGFEGRISMKMAGDRPATVEYAAKGDKVKLTIERAPGDVGEEVAAIIDRSDNKVTLLSEDAKKYAEVDLDKAYERARELASKVTLEKTGEKRTISGVECDNWKLTDGERKVTACVAKGPAYFDPAALENAAGVELPAWVERIVREGYFPLGVTITDAAGKKLTAGEVTKWTEGPVEPGDVAVPKDYQKVDRSELRSRAKEAVEERMP